MWRGAATIWLICQVQITLFVVVGELGWSRWCRGELGKSSAGDGRWAYLLQVPSVERLVGRRG